MLFKIGAVFFISWLNQGLRKPAGRLIAGFFTDFSGKTGFFTENVHFWGTISVTTHFKDP
jgi:hypothetical protein